MFYVENGRRKDRWIHEEILAEGDHAAAKAVSDRARAARRLAKLKDKT